ncbi:MAG: hypothetical protein HY363_02850 [Candidatus Aenigmarchaeota archaeon]|nr:hypothetical protein [Candidatus Aenigmarchaeota archaeon]
MQELVISGTPSEIGMQHGKALSREIRQVFDIYKKEWRCSDESIPDKVKGFKKTLEMYFPHLSEEIKGIAKGAEVAEDFIYAINARTELMPYFSLECTSVGIKSCAQENSHAIIGQNWDWLDSLRPLTRVADVRPHDKPRMKMLIEPGMVGKIGMNDAGVGVCLNFLHTRAPNTDGIPVHVILRAILESKSYEQAARKVSGLPRAASANYIIGDKNSTIASLETTTSSVCIIEPKKGVVTHTNAYSSRGETCTRQQEFENTLYKHAKLSIDAVADSLRNVEAESVFKGGIETVHTVLLNLSMQHMMISGGCANHNFETYEFL